VRVGTGAPRACLITTTHPERSLSRALAEHLREELPDIRFILREEEALDLVWVCGYERGHAELLRGLRARHPEALLLVTSKTATEVWSHEALAAGADHALTWPVPMSSLTSLLYRRGA
jgi:DNA-binding NarL/FixJ family response regulator